MSEKFNIGDQLVFPAGHNIDGLINTKITVNVAGISKNGATLVSFNEELFDSKIASVYLTSNFSDEILMHSYGASKNIRTYKYVYVISKGDLRKAFVEQKSSVATTNKMLDLSDWRTWRSQAPGQCACGMTKSLCTYHKD